MNKYEAVEEWHGRTEVLRVIEGRTDQRNAQINFSLINLLLFKLLRHVSAT